MPLWLGRQRGRRTESAIRGAPFKAISSIAVEGEWKERPWLQHDREMRGALPRVEHGLWGIKRHGQDGEGGQQDEEELQRVVHAQV